jgi:hypothetical protein
VKVDVVLVQSGPIAAAQPTNGKVQTENKIRHRMGKILLLQFDRDSPDPIEDFVGELHAFAVDFLHRISAFSSPML